MTDHCQSCPFAACPDCRFQPTANQEDRPMTDTNPAAGVLSDLDRALQDANIHPTDARLIREAAEREVARVTAAVEALESHEVINPGGLREEVVTMADLRAALSSADTTLDDLLDRERAKAAGEAWDEAAELADSVIVSWAAVPGLHPEAQEPHPAAIAAAGARRTLVVLRSRMTEAFIDRAAAASPEQPRPDVAGGDEPPLPVRGDGNTGRGAAAVSPEGGGSDG